DLLPSCQRTGFQFLSGPLEKPVGLAKASRAIHGPDRHGVKTLTRIPLIIGRSVNQSLSIPRHSEAIAFSNIRPLRRAGSEPLTACATASYAGRSCFRPPAALSFDFSRATNSAVFTGAGLIPSMVLARVGSPSTIQPHASSTVQPSGHLNALDGFDGRAASASM